MQYVNKMKSLKGILISKILIFECMSVVNAWL